MPLLGSITERLNRGTVSVRGRATYAADTLPSYESEALGGDGALVRGYDADELGRTHSSAGATAELMVPLGSQPSQPIALAIFADAGAGSVCLNARDKQFTMRGGTAIGCGLRYGPFRIDWAWNAEGRRKTHVGLVGE